MHQFIRWLKSPNYTHFGSLTPITLPAGHCPADQLYESKIQVYGDIVPLQMLF